MLNQLFCRRQLRFCFSISGGIIATAKNSLMEMCPSKCLWCPLVLNNSDSKCVLAKGRSYLLLNSLLISAVNWWWGCLRQKCDPYTSAELIFLLVSENFALFFPKKEQQQKEKLVQNLTLLCITSFTTWKSFMLRQGALWAKKIQVSS